MRSIANIRSRNHFIFCRILVESLYSIGPSQSRHSKYRPEFKIEIAIPQTKVQQVQV
jgi:hypothetical protein